MSEQHMLPARSSTWEVQLPRGICWHLETAGPDEFALQGASGWHLINPIHCTESPSPHDHIYGIHDGRLICELSTLVLRREPPAGDDFGALFPVLVSFLQQLRRRSGQFALPIEGTAFSPGEFSGRPFPASSGSGRVVVRSYMRSTLITDSILADAALHTAAPVPVYANVMLEGLNAHALGDVRRAILFGAIAMEAGAGEMLEEDLVRALAAGGNQHRVVTRQGPTGSVRKDPVADALAESGAAGPRSWLHVRPLYLRGKSLLLDDEATYTRAERLYRTRNKLAHTATVPNDSDCYQLSAKDTETALRAAARALEWYGDPGPYVVWDGSWVDLVTGSPVAL